jgi:L-fucose mutarotase/ribose pyranase (RbsD/FucU family)
VSDSARVSPARGVDRLPPVLRFPLLHPPLLAALGAAGHGARVLLADANYSHSTNVSPAAAVMATGDDRLYANLLLTIGFVDPR